MSVPDYSARRSSLERLRLARMRALNGQRGERLRRGRKPRDGEAGETVPVEPNRSLDLSGGAAAALVFDD